MSLVLVLTCTSLVNMGLRRSGLPVLKLIIQSDDSSFGTEEETRHTDIMHSKEQLQSPFMHQ